MPKLIKKQPVKSKPKSLKKISKAPKHVPNKFISKVNAKEIEKASKRIRPIVHWTPLEQSNGMSKMFSANVFIKHEQTQFGGSFKLRGVTNHLKSLTPKQRAKGVVTASTGNHGVAVAYASKLLGIESTIFLCDFVPQVKIDNINAYGSKYQLVKGWCLDAEKEARKHTDKYYIPPYNSHITINGAGTMGLEIWNQMKDLNVKNIDAVFACIGGGGLTSGVSTYLKSKNPKIKVYGCSARRTPAMYECVKYGKIVEIQSYPSIADGNGGNIEKGSLTFDIVKKNLDEIILVEEDDIKLATRIFMETERAITEPTAAVSIAGFMKKYKQFKGKNVVIITCGRNVTMQNLNKILQDTKNMKLK